MANSLMNILGGIGGGNGGLFMKAVGAMMRGESPQDFMKSLAQSNPSLGGIDLSDLNGEAQRICKERGIDPNKLTEQIKSTLANMK
jgi:hypothetical protein